LRPSGSRFAQPEDLFAPPGTAAQATAGVLTMWMLARVQSANRPSRWDTFVNRSAPGRNRGVMDDDGLIARVAAGDDGAPGELFPGTRRG
jgi:hypothetical protein